MKTGMMAMILLASTSAWAGGFHGLNSKDDCYAAVVGLSQGLSQSYKVYNGKAAQILKVELSSLTETRLYSVDLTHDGSFDSYQIELSNDSATKCILENMKPVEIGG